MEQSGAVRWLGLSESAEIAAAEALASEVDGSTSNGSAAVTINSSAQVHHPADSLPSLMRFAKGTSSDKTALRTQRSGEQDTEEEHDDEEDEENDDKEDDDDTDGDDDDGQEKDSERLEKPAAKKIGEAKTLGEQNRTAEISRNASNATKILSPVEKVEKQIEANTARQDGIKREIEALENNDNADLDTAVEKVQNETHSVHMAAFLGEMWKEMRTYATPLYIEHLEEETMTLAKENRRLSLRARKLGEKAAGDHTGNRETSATSDRPKRVPRDKWLQGPVGYASDDE